jgi:hypothetical protein
MASNSKSKNMRIAEDTKLGAGLVANHAKGETFVVNAKKQTVTQILALIKARIDATATVESTHAAWLEAVRAEQAVLEESNPTLAGVRQTLRTTLGESAQQLSDYGLAPRTTRRALTVEEKLLAKKRNAATRKARGTRGARQKAKIVGQVPAPDPQPTGARARASKGAVTNGAAPHTS